MLRKMLTIFSLIGLLLSVGLWGVSCVGVVRFSKSCVVQFRDGSLLYESRPYSGASGWHIWPSGVSFRSLLPGFVSIPANPSWEIWVPFWIPVVTLGVTFWLCRPLYHHRRRKRKKLGVCLKCGYDLRGSKGRAPDWRNESELTCSATR